MWESSRLIEYCLWEWQVKITRWWSPPMGLGLKGNSKLLLRWNQGWSVKKSSRKLKKAQGRSSLSQTQYLQVMSQMYCYYATWSENTLRQWFGDQKQWSCVDCFIPIQSRRGIFRSVHKSQSFLVNSLKLAVFPMLKLKNFQNWQTWSHNLRIMKIRSW